MTDKTRPYVVRSGDHLASIAHAHGVRPEDVWNHLSNASLRTARKNFNILAPGDVLYIPIVERAWLPITTGTKNRIVVTVPSITVRLRLHDASGPFKNEKVRVGGGSASVETRTDGDGKLKFSARATDSVVRLELPDRKYVVDVRVGGLDPIDTASGQWERLRHLGHVGSTDSGGSGLGRAFSRFQEAQGLAVTAAADRDTLEKLQSRYGC
jgi:hypothetical protein